MNPEIQTRSTYVNIFRPDPESLDICDIAHALAYNCRFSGFTSRFYCVTPETRVLTHDFNWVPAGDIRTGQMLWGFDEHSKAHRDIRKWRPSEATVHGRIVRNLVRVTLEDGTILRCSMEHPILCATKISGNQLWLTARQILTRHEEGRAVYLPKLLPTWTADASYLSGWLAGILDGEGSITTKKSRGVSVTVAQNLGPTLSSIEAALRAFGADFTRSKGSGKTCYQLRVRGGLSEQMALLGTVRPERLLSRLQVRLNGTEAKRAGPLVKVADVVAIGPGEVVALETSTHTYVTEGIGSHNSVAQHSYNVSVMLSSWSVEIQLAGLLHDAAEAYMGDMPTPHKQRFHEFREVEVHLQSVIFDRYGLKWPIDERVHWADNVMLHVEANALLPRAAWVRKEAQPTGVDMTPWPIDSGKRFFLLRFRELASRLV